MANKSQPLALPDDVFAMLAQADKQRNFPPGTMQALLMQETGGKPQYLTDPTTYHYPLNAEGRRVAGHTGQISTAHGPFGILESTAKDPGYGVKPMGDKTNLAEHVRFAADYLDARSKSAGSLQAGLAGYGEGAKYSNQVMRRIAPEAAPVVLAQAADTPALNTPVPAPVVPPIQAQGTVAQTPAVPPPPLPSSWEQFVAERRAAEAKVVPTDLAYGEDTPYVPTQVVRPDFMAALGSLGQRPSVNFNPFSGFGATRARA